MDSLRDNSSKKFGGSSQIKLQYEPRASMDNLQMTYDELDWSGNL